MVEEMRDYMQIFFLEANRQEIRNALEEHRPPTYYESTDPRIMTYHTSPGTIEKIRQIGRPEPRKPLAWLKKQGKTKEMYEEIERLKKETERWKPRFVSAERLLWASRKDVPEDFEYERKSNEYPALAIRLRPQLKALPDYTKGIWFSPLHRPRGYGTIDKRTGALRVEYDETIAGAFDWYIKHIMMDKRKGLIYDAPSLVAYITSGTIVGFNRAMAELKESGEEIPQRYLTLKKRFPELTVTSV